MPRGARPLLSAPWLRAPLVGLRQWAVALPVAAAAAVLALAAASGPLFLSSVASAGVARAVERDCPEAPLARVEFPPYADDRPGAFGRGRTAGNRPDQAPGDVAQLDRADRAVQAALREQGLAPAFRVLTASVPAQFGPGARPQSVSLLARPELPRHVDVVAGDPGRPGLWMSDLAAARAGVGVGDTVVVAGERAPVVALYRDLVGPGYGGDLRRDWCTWGRLIRVTLDYRPPPLLLADEATLLRLQRRGAPEQARREQAAGRSGWNVASATWYSPLDLDRLTLAGAREAQERATRLSSRDLRGVPAGLAYDLRTGSLPDYVALAERGTTAVRGPVWPVTLAGTLVALLLVAAAGGHWVERRRGEALLLTARGAGPAAVGLKAVLETALPALAGAVAGCLAARALVGTLGPSPLLEPGALVTALGVAGAATVAGLLLLGAVAGRRTAAVERAAPGAAGWRWLPWELVPAVLAVLAYREVGSAGAVRADDTGLLGISPLLLAFPLLALAAGLGVAVRLGGPPLRAARRLAARLRPAAYLGLSRLTAAGRVSLALVALVAVPVGVLVYASTVVRTAETTTAAKAGLYTGADVAVVTYLPPGTAPAVGGAGTSVAVISDGSTVVGQTAVLGVDPDTFARFAWSDRAVLGDSVGPLVDRIRAPAGGRRTPALLAGCPDCPAVTSVRLRSGELAVDVVARPRYFPGLRLLRGPTLVVDRAALAGVDRYTQWQEEVWTTADRRGEVGDALLRAGVRVDRVKSPDGFLSVTELTPLVWSFGYLRALAALTGAIALAALILYVAARERQRSVSQVLARRMGLRRRTHLLSLAQELGWLVGAGWLAGVLLGWAAALLVTRLLDFDPDFPPAAVVAAPVGLLLATAAAAAVFVLIGMAVAQRSADRTKPAEVLRLGG